MSHGEGNGNKVEEYGHIDIPIHQYYSADRNNDLPNQIKGSGFCDHTVYGMDCVGFIYQCAKAAGIPDMGGKWGYGPEKLAMGSSWAEFSKATNETKIANTLPEPGDILSWGDGHVGIAVRMGNGVVGVIHASGQIYPRLSPR